MTLSLTPPQSTTVYLAYGFFAVYGHLRLGSLYSRSSARVRVSIALTNPSRRAFGRRTIR